MSDKRDKYTLPGVGFLMRTGKYAPDPKYAAFNRRMLAATIDSLLALLVLAPAMTYLLRHYYPAPMLDWLAVRAQIPQDATEDEVNHIISQYLLTSGYIKYQFNNFLLQCAALATASGLCWHFWSATPGKMLLGMKVVDANTEAKLTPNQILTRLFGYVISTLFLCIGFLWIGVDKRRQGWHDKMAGSVVIRVPRRKKAEATPEAEAAAASDSPVPSRAE